MDQAGAVSTAGEQEARKPTTLSEWLNESSNKARIEEYSADCIDPNKMIKLALLCVSENELLQKCSMVSILKAIVVSASCGLRFGMHSTAQAYLVPFKKKGKYECQLIPGYRGLMDLCYRSNMVNAIDAHIVYRNESFNIQLGTDTVINHVPNLDGARGDVRGVYALATLKSGTDIAEWMSDEDCKNIMAQSPSGKFEWSPWNKWYAEMCRKSVIRKICKRLPASVEMDNALGADDKIHVEHRKPAQLPASRGTLTDQLKASIDMADENQPENTEDQPDVERTDAGVAGQGL